MRQILLSSVLVLLISRCAGITNAEDSLDALPPMPDAPIATPTDWLIDESPYRAGVYRTGRANEIALTNGLVKRTFRIAPNGATVGLDNLINGQAVLRGVKPEARVTLDGMAFDVGGLVGQPNYAYLPPAWLDNMQTDPHAFQMIGFDIGEPQERFAWKRVRHHAPDVQWPPRGVHLRMDYKLPEVTDERAAEQANRLAEVVVSVHYELYDGLPLMSKWLTVRNPGGTAVTVDRFTSELLAVVEESNWVEMRDGVALPRPSSLHVETDFAFGGFNAANANRHIVHWRPDPQYRTQVNYRRQQPLLLVVEPTYGPAQEVAPGGCFDSCRAFELLYDSSDRERRSLALRRMYRTIAPWVTENPLMMHLRHARDPQVVKQAVDQCAEVGFEMVILSFGSGFNIENEDPAYLAAWKDIAQYAQGKGIEIGGYSLLSSRRIGGGNDVVSPAGLSPTHGNCPALTSEWGQDYFRKLVQFFDKTGFTLLEHDGSYPGDVDITARPPLQKGEADSRWAQWRIISDFYQWCRARGIYLNVPDYYYLAGSNKCGMGYRETNWSLPREQQVIHTRQNIFDGTWTKTPSMGWMFVPLTQYHGGGLAATIEPLAEHLEHYESMLAANLGLGVQACYRGPRLYDTDATQALVKGWVDWYLKYRDILESDVVHGRRADGRDLDWMLHVNPKLETKGMLVVFNPLPESVSRTLRVNLVYTGLTGRVTVLHEGSDSEVYSLNRQYQIDIPVQVPAEGMTWFVIK